MLLMVVTTAYMPIVLPLLLPGIAVKPWDIAETLIVYMLIPLTIGLGIRHYASKGANRYRGLLSKVSTLFLSISVVLNVVLSGANIIRLMGTGSLLALLLFIAGSLVIGLFLGGPDPSIYKVTGLGTAQRDLAAAIAVSARNFPGTMTMPFIVVAAILLLLILLPTARYLDLRSERGGACQAARSLRSRWLRP